MMVNWPLSLAGTVIALITSYALTNLRIPYLIRVAILSMLLFVMSGYFLVPG